VSEGDRNETLRLNVQADCDTYRIGIQAELLTLESGGYLVVLRVPKVGFNRVTLDPLVRRIQAMNGVEQVTMEPIEIE
jgi:hypothetical protein